MTETALAIREDFKITPTDLRKFIAPTASEKEFGMLMGICQSFRLNPFKREVHFVKYGNNPANIIVGYEIYLKRAERTGKLDGWKCWIEKDTLGEKAVIEIKRKDQSTPIRWEVYRSEFDKQQSTWKSMPTFMLKKVAIAQGFRLAFPDDLGGMPYIPEEMPTDKGGGVSESLPKGEVVEAAVVEDVPEFSPPPPVSTDAEMAPETEMITDPQIKKIQILMKGKGSRDAKLDYLTAWRRRYRKDPEAPAMGSSNEFTKAEASAFIEDHNG